MSNLTGWWETITDDVCKHDTHLIHNPALVFEFKQEGWVELTKEELAVLILRWGITQIELDSGSVCRPVISRA